MQLLIFNEEFLVNVSHQLALITSLPFVHTARRYYRLNGPVSSSDWRDAAGSPAAMHREVMQTLSFRGSKSRNKVSVGEPAEGSLPVRPRPLAGSRARQLPPGIGRGRGVRVSLTPRPRRAAVPVRPPEPSRRLRPVNAGRRRRDLRAAGRPAHPPHWSGPCPEPDGPPLPPRGRRNPASRVPLSSEG